MRSITFYSYKGGTGRTLLMTNVGVLGARLGATVVMVDMDFEAPGLEYKFPHLTVGQHPGVVDYLAEARSAGPVPLSSYVQWLEVPHPIVPGGRLGVISAGRAPSPGYFDQLSELDLDRLTVGRGMEALLAMVSAAESELEADFLLIDSRTGITNSNKATTRAMADAVVALAVDSPEQLDGTRAVLRSLQPLTSLRTDAPIELVVVRSRSAALKTAAEQHADPDSEISRMTRFLNEPGHPLSTTLQL